MCLWKHGKQTRVLIGELAEVADNDANDDSVNAEGRSENLGNQHLREQSAVLSITQCATRSTDTDRETTVNRHSFLYPLTTLEMPTLRPALKMA